MANPLTAGTLQLSCQTNIAGATIGAQGTAAQPTISLPTASVTGVGQSAFSFGTASGQCDILCAGDYDLTAGSNVTIDLFANGLPNVFGGTANFLHLKAMFVGIVSGGDSAGVTIGNAGANPHPLFFGAVGSVWTIFPVSGIPLQGSSPTGVVVDGTHRNVKILNQGSVTVTVRIMFGGTSV